MTDSRWCHPERSTTERSEVVRSRKIPTFATTAVAIGILRLRGFRTRRESTPLRMTTQKLSAALFRRSEESGVQHFRPGSATREIPPPSEQRRTFGMTPRWRRHRAATSFAGFRRIGNPLPIPLGDARHCFPAHESLSSPVLPASSKLAIEINEVAHVPDENFIREAKRAGLKFTFGTDSRNQNAAHFYYCYRMDRGCGLTPGDMWVPMRS